LRKIGKEDIGRPVQRGRKGGTYLYLQNNWKNLSHELVVVTVIKM